MGINTTLAGASAAGQFVAPAGGVKLAELTVGAMYRVTVTAVYPGKAEILIGNQYLLAATPFRFQEGDVITLKLAARSPELLQFQLALPAGVTEQAAADLATLMRAAALPDTAANRAALTLLLQSSTPVSARAVADLAQLLNALPHTAVAAFMPVYKQLLERDIRLDKSLLLHLARLEQSSTSPQPLAAVLAGALGQLQRERERGGQRRRAFEAALGAVLQEPTGEAGVDSAQQLKEHLAMLYRLPQDALLELLRRLSREGGDGDAPHASRLELTDLFSLAADEQQSAELAAVLEFLQSIRIANTLHPGRLELVLPAVLDGEPTDVQLHLQLLSEQYYHKDYAMRIRVENNTQGKVEFQLRTRGPGLYVDILAEDESTLAAYAGEAERLSTELSADTGFQLRKLELSQHSL